MWRSALPVEHSKMFRSMLIGKLTLKSATLGVRADTLMQPLLSQFQTPTTPRRVRRFFRVWMPTGLPVTQPVRLAHSPPSDRLTVGVLPEAFAATPALPFF